MKKIILTMLILVLLVVSFGCTQIVKDPVKEPVKEPPIDKPVENIPDEVVEIDEVKIKPVDKINVDNLSLLDEYLFDFDKDGVEEKIGMYTKAEKGPDGEIYWDDGQNWLFVVQDSDKDYILVDEYVQLGKIDFNIYTIEDDFYITTYSARTASLTLNLYHYDSETDSFIMTVPFNTSGNVNMLKSSYGY